MRKYILPTLLFCSVIVLFFACRKSDVTERDTITKQNIQESRFFNVPASASPQAKGIAEAIKKQNAKHNFLSSVISKAGYPVWDKAKIVNLKNGTISGRGTNASDTGEVVYVPFVLDSQNRVNAVLSVNLQSTDTAYSILYASRYKMFGYDTTDHSKWNARDAFNFFVSFDNSVFGHTKFLIKDDSLFPRQLDTSFIVVTLTHIGGQPVSARNNVASAEVCVTYQTCETAGAPCATPSSGPSSSSACTPLAARTTTNGCTTSTSCTTYFFDNDGGWWSGPPTVTTGGGNGGGTPGWTEGQPCPPNSSARVSVVNPNVGCIPGWVPVGYNQNNVSILANLVRQNPAYLVNPCLYINQFLYLSSFQAPQVVLDRLNTINQAYLNSPNPAYVQHPTYLQNINDAESVIVNFDYFPIHITTLPTVNGVQMTPQLLFEYFRTHWDLFVDNSIATFNPYQDAIVNDVNLWNSFSPLTTLLHLNMTDNGTVIVSDFYSTTNKAYLTATTVRTPLDGTHPVSGNRSWGIDVDPNGGYFFYTTAADRMTGVAETVWNTWAERLPILESGFESADALWTSLQTKMIKFIKDNQGHAELYNQLEPNYIIRPHWIDIHLYLKNQIDLNELKRRIGC